MKWLGPATPQAIEQAGHDSVGAVVVPIAFVSEHIETLVELDHEYAELAEQVGCAPYLRTPAVGIDPAFIAGLAQTVKAALETSGVAPQGVAKGAFCSELKACAGGCSKRAKAA